MKTAHARASRWMKWLLAALIGAMLLTYVSLWQVMAKPGASDFYKFHISAGRLLHGQGPIYWKSETTPACHASAPPENATGPRDACLHPNLNTPVFILLTLPLALLDYQAAWSSWSCLSLLSALVALWLIIRKQPLRTRQAPQPKPLLMLAIVLAYPPSLANFMLGQVSFQMLLALTLSWLALRAGRTGAAAAMLGLLASMKPFAGLFCVLFLLLRQWRAAGLFVLSGGLALGLSTLIAGPENARAYLDALHHVSWQGSNWNASANGFLTRLLGGGETPALVSVPLSGAQATLLVWLAMIPVLHDMSRQLPRLPPSHQADFLFALTPPAMLLLSPLGWIYYFPMLLLSLLILWQYSANLPGRTTRRLCLLLAITMTSLPRDLLPAAEPGDWRGVLLDAGLSTYALIILLLTGLRMLRDHARYGSSASAPR